MTKSMVETIQTTLSEQLQQLVNTYEQEIENLLHTIELLEDENAQLLEQLENEQCELNIVEQWLDDCLNATLQKDDVHLLSLTSSVKVPAKFIVSLPKEQRFKMIYTTLDFLANSSANIDTYVLLLIKELLRTRAENDVRISLKSIYDFLFENVVIQTTTHSLLIEIFTLSKQPKMLNMYINELYKKSNLNLWAQLSPEALIELFWISFSCDFEDTFLTNCPRAQQKEMAAHVLAPTYYFDFSNESFVSFYHRIKHLLKAYTLLDEQRKNIIFVKLNNQLKKEQRKTILHFSKNNLHVVKDEDFVKFQKHFILTKQPIVTNVYTMSSIQNITFEAFVKDDGSEAFIQESVFKHLEKQNKPGEIKASSHYYNFTWPTINVITRKDSTEKKQFDYKELSDLAEIGYIKVTSKTKAERLAILDVAVKKIGLYKVAHTIAQNIRRKKAVRDGEKKYARSIHIWTEDLQHLKTAYYDHTFRWPPTSI